MFQTAYVSSAWDSVLPGTAWKPLQGLLTLPSSTSASSFSLCLPYLPTHLPQPAPAAAFPCPGPQHTSSLPGPLSGWCLASLSTRRSVCEQPRQTNSNPIRRQQGQAVLGPSCLLRAEPTFSFRWGYNFNEVNFPKSNLADLSVVDGFYTSTEF